MRLFIIVLSFIFFILSGLIIYRALEIPGYDFSYKYKQQRPELQAAVPAPQDNSDRLLKEQTSNNIQYEKLKTEIEVLEKKLEGKQKKNAVVTGDNDASKKENVIAVLGGRTFGPGQVVVSEGFTGTVKELVKTIMGSPDDHVVIEGHTDNLPIKSAQGSLYKDNMDLSYLRAKAIARILIENGISNERISVIGYGYSRPAASNETREGRAKNRRVEVKLIPGTREL